MKIVEFEGKIKSRAYIIYMDGINYRNAVRSEINSCYALLATTNKRG